MKLQKAKFDDSFGKLEITQEFTRVFIPNGDGTYQEFSGLHWVTHNAGGGTSCDCRYCESWQGKCTNAEPDNLRTPTCLDYCVSGCSHFKLSNKFVLPEQPTLF